MRILVTGSQGFIGRNLMAALRQRADVSPVGFDLADDPACLAGRVLEADAIVHLAGVNRPQHVDSFHTGNAGLTEQLVNILEKAKRATPLILSSSTQAAQDNPYGLSKRIAEEIVISYGHRSGAQVCVYRFPNVFGKWCRPNYNSVVATFCHNICRSLPIQINDPKAQITLVYIDDVLEELLRALDGRPTIESHYCHVPIQHQVNLGDLADLLSSFRNSRLDLSLPELSNPFAKKLYSTYLSYLPEDGFSYPLNMHVDDRGSFTEFIRTPERGQVSVNISKPGITKGNHWHHTKNEKFLVVSGRGVIRFRKLGSDMVISYEVSGEKLEVVDIPPGYTHDITNTGNSDLVTVMWVNEPYDRDRPDTFYEKV
jgi:UDP-2-acetamido-2,6-beta-L-arabino-hexul-4-ose reductase